MISRRELLAAGAILPLFGASSILRANEPDLSALRAITGNARPIEAAERTRRLTRAQALMKANDIGAVVIEPGSSMIYFTGVEWWRSERLTAVVLPVEGKPCIVTPFFRSEEHTSELQSLMRISYAVFCLKKKKSNNVIITS